MLILNAVLRCKASIVLVLIAIAMFGSSTSAQGDDKETNKPEPELLTCRVLVVDPDGNPVQEATVYCTGMRTRIEPGSHWGWSLESHGPLPKLKTGEDGIAEMPYPKYVAEKLETGKMTWTVEHPDFVAFRQDRSVDDDPAEITLSRGFRIAVTAVNGETGEKIKNDLYAVIGGPRADWKLAKSGMLVSPMFAKKNTTMRICQLVDGQQTLFSESIKIEPGDRSRVLLKNLKLSVGTRVEGKLDESVERPVTNGHVSVVIVRKMQENDWQTRWDWYDKTPILEDGSFVFESLPSDEVLQMIPVCDGWVPSKPTKESVLQHFPNEVQRLEMHNRVLPQLIELHGEKVTAKLMMKKSTSVQVTVKGPAGDPLLGANVSMWPNQIWFDGGSQILGSGFSQRERLVKSRAGEWEFNRVNRFNDTTDQHGIAVINNLPAGSTESISVSHDDYDMPISGERRSMRVDLKPGVVAEVTINMQMKGTDALGAPNDDDGDE